MTLLFNMGPEVLVKAIRQQQQQQQQQQNTRNPFWKRNQTILI